MQGFFALKKWEFMTRSPNVHIYAKVFKFMVYFMLVWPIGTIIAWGVSGILYLFIIIK